MDTQDPPPRRRGNGLPASSYVPLADVEPRLGEHLLDLLKFAEIAAFLEPPSDPRMARRPGVGMVQRLYVEQDKRGEARDLVERAAEEAGAATTTSTPPDDRPDPLAGLDLDAEFAKLIADWDTDAARDDEQSDAGSGPSDDDPAPRRVGRDPEALERALRDLDRIPPVPNRSLDEVDLSDDHYEPPPPPPLPLPAPATVGAAAVFVFGILVVWRGDWFGLAADVSFPLGLVLVLAGFVMFVLRLRDAAGDDEDADDDDDGARI